MKRMIFIFLTCICALALYNLTILATLHDSMNTRVTTAHAQDDFIIEDETILVQYTGNASNVTIPPQITKICANCMKNSQDIISITLPDGLLEIGAVAFSGCTNLESINIPDTVTTIGLAAFANCSSLTSVTIPASVTELEQLLFTGCSSLKQIEIQSETSSVPYLCFSECAVEEITLPDSVQVIANQAFANCQSLKTVHTGTQLQKIEEKAFLNCTQLEDISLPAQMQFIDTTAFDGCDLLKEKHTVNGSFIIDQILIQAEPQYPIYQIPDNVITVMNDAVNQTRAVAIECPDSLRYLRESAFASNSELMDIKLNQGCQMIAENALSDCRSLNSVFIPDSVKSIEHQDNLYLTALYGIPGSAAEEFAANNQISFHENKPVQNYANVKFDYTKDGWHFGNTKNVFGENYILTEQDRAYLSDLGIDAENIDKEWQGACAGLSSTVILMKNGIISPQQFQEDSISEIELTKAVQSFINFYQLSFIKRNSGQWKSTNQKIYLLNEFLPTKQREGELFLLTFSLSSGSHAVVGYELESGKWEYDGKSYDRRILVWDPNYPNALHEDSCMYFNRMTFDYCIPDYGVHVAEGSDENIGALIDVENDLTVINKNPYPFDLYYSKGDLNCDGKVSFSDVDILINHLNTKKPLSVTQMYLADLSNDMIVNSADLSLLKKEILS